ncbi:hypothetical protein A1Q1_02955 [Trichosporon asahii var. asahii CBS 2479]|uniref:Uncharacterized protein n=1 Tax=Trichosporon asahii var. asahii (strain ATCC 90039 / CBS 2479 / JCM 2466 / KCTC 7840 / NBRC 103889/ NCYC 2677 / UAMH 7654) TaxID=1186058 RepID=J6EU08_TRIAS|nr:hypothetical protein A1Q1_02955 [Trichosporon asahii var. asahii CBS 2479]EJT48039.1 hypothetical protein A1Q1_02955 [Trichosporon asahii var. asahii CBS 2479]
MKIEEGEWAGWECQGEVLIECEHDKDFRIVVEPPASNTRHFCVWPCIDGQEIGSTVSTSLEQPRCQIRSRYEKENDAIAEKSLRFVALERVPEQMSSQQANIQSLGSIAVTMHKGWGSLGHRRRPWISQSPTSSISEKVKKMSPGVQLQLRLSKGADSGVAKQEGDAVVQSIIVEPTNDDSDDGIVSVEQPAEIDRPQVSVDLTQDDASTVRGSPVRKSAGGPNDLSDSNSDSSDSSTASDDDAVGEDGQPSEATVRAVARAKAKAKLKARLKYKLKSQLKAELKAKADRKAARKTARKGKGKEKQGAQ